MFGLSLDTSEKTMLDYFSQFGKIERCEMVFDRKTGRSRGFGFIYYQNLEDAIAAKDRAPGLEIEGHRVRVDYSITKRAHTPTPGIYMGKPTARGRRDRYDDYYSGGRGRSPSPYYRGGGGGGSRRSRSYSYSPRREYR